MMDVCYENFKDGVHILYLNSRVVHFGDFNARIRSAAEVDDVTGMLVKKHPTIMVRNYFPF